MLNKISTQVSSVSGIIKNQSRGKRIAWIGAIALIIVAAVAGTIYYRQGSPSSQTATDQPQTQTAVIRQGDLAVYASGTGTLIAQSEASFGFDTSGQVTRVNVQVGDVVESGQVLAELNSESATLAYQQARRTMDELTSPASIATAKQTLATAQDDLVTTRTALQYLVSPAVQIWTERLADAQAALAQAEAEAAANPSDEAKQKVKDAQDAVTLAQANLASANKDYPSYLKATFTETETNPRTGEEKVVYYVDETGKRYTNMYAPYQTEIDSAQAAYDLAKATVEETQIYLAALNGEEIPEGATGSSLSTYINANENLVAAQEELDYTKLTAPISGTLMSLDLNLGDYVSSGSAIATISDLTHPSLEIYMDESDWLYINVGNPVEVTFDILPSRTFSGKIIQVDPGLYSGDFGTSVVRAIVNLDAVDESFNLPLGTSASVEVTGGSARGAILVPIEALNQDGDQYFVYVQENGTFTKRVVEIGLQDTLYAEVTSGLKAGEVVATNYTETK
jgi:HlyD family secretion protein